jgi:hypothetical protein
LTQIAPRENNDFLNSLNWIWQLVNEIAEKLATRLFDQRVIQNDYRSAFVEAMLESFLEPIGWEFKGANWNGWDFESRTGEYLEVKQSSALQTWHKEEAIEVSVNPSFDIGLRKGSYDGSKFTRFDEPKRIAHIYVFAWHGKIGPEADHRVHDQWELFVLPTHRLPAIARIRLKRLRRLVGRTAIGPAYCAEHVRLLQA